jgi:hypothetical protein
MAWPRVGAGRRGLALGCGLALLPGCAGLQQPEVEQVAVGFSTGDPAVRCALLAPATLSALETSESAGCVQAVGALAPAGGQVQRAVVWGDKAQVQMADDTLFLTLTGTGWRVAAAGCTPSAEAPYACRVEGP